VNTVIDQLNTPSIAANELVFRQLFEKESSTYTYLLADSLTKETLLIDPVLETVARYSTVRLLSFAVNLRLILDFSVRTGTRSWCRTWA